MKQDGNEEAASQSRPSDTADTPQRGDASSGMSATQQRSPRANAASDRLARSQRPQNPGVRQTLYDVIFEADTPLGRWFDIALLLAILASITLVAWETVPGFRNNPDTKPWFITGELILTGLFTIEYGLRLYCARRPWRYAFSFWGIIDLLSILPTYVALIPSTVNSRSFVILRSIRLLRVFRVLKLWRMMSEADDLSAAIWRAREKIIVFLVVVLVAVTISGTLMYFVETELWEEAGATADQQSDFTSIPQAMYWAIVTMTTVGYGDVVPHTAPGKVISAALILLGYSLIIVPTGFVSAELTSSKQVEREYHPCHRCGADRHRLEASFCYRCGAALQQ
ncbi:Cyclic nucleotide-gated potassium channel [Crateriforma conspicua]|uniref:Cyclic nucleotide-gated potassium channel n=1 Tax=Crateriforma conspicua TaxID=2527996 RepID=A0A5C6FSA7_9PLAN|nr:ion transporter [Crateriforma conspicua]TWU65917.1 Cyclic nucleotide-gated potassium channel [Crateriforma conspicua]